MRHALLSALAIALLAIVLEVFLFNFNFFTSMGYQERHLEKEFGLVQDAQGDYCLHEFKHRIELANLGEQVSNIHLAFDEEAPAQLLTVKIQFTDSAHRLYFGTTEYTQGIPLVNVSTASPESGYIHVRPSGKVGNLAIEIVGDEVSYPIRLKSVSINAPEPFAFNFTRLAVVFAIMYLGYLFRPHSRIYRIGIVEETVFTKRAIIAAVLVEVFLVSSFMFMGSNLVGIASKSYNYGSWDRESIVNVYDAGGDNAQQYALLAHSLAEGHLHLDVEPPE